MGIATILQGVTDMNSPSNESLINLCKRLREYYVSRGDCREAAKVIEVMIKAEKEDARPHVTSPADLPAPPATRVEMNLSEQDLLDMIAEAIDDSMDYDWTSSIGAKSVVRRLRDEGLLEKPRISDE